MTVHESKHASYADLARLHHPYGDLGSATDLGTPVAGPEPAPPEPAPHPLFHQHEAPVPQHETQALPAQPVRPGQPGRSAQPGRPAPRTPPGPETYGYSYTSDSVHPRNAANGPAESYAPSQRPPQQQESRPVVSATPEPYAPSRHTPQQQESRPVVNATPEPYAPGRPATPEPESPPAASVTPEAYAPSRRSLPPKEATEPQLSESLALAPKPEPRQAQPPVRRALYKQADLGRLRTSAERAAGNGDEDCFDQLAWLAEPEEWSGPTGTRDTTWVLREYVEWNFERLHQQRRVVNSPDGSYSVFNTGLMTRQHETIYGVFAPNRDPEGPPWQLMGWFPESERELHEHFPELPGPAVFTEDPADLVYDWRCPLTASSRTLLDSQENLTTLPEPLSTNPYQAGLVLEGALRRAETRARRSYRAAVPCWDPVSDRVRLLLPLSLTTPETVDAALVVWREGSTYRGHTVLGLDEAYARARLLAHPETWLNT